MTFSELVRAQPRPPKELTPSPGPGAPGASNRAAGAPANWGGEPKSAREAPEPLPLDTPNEHEGERERALRDPELVPLDPLVVSLSSPMAMLPATEAAPEPRGAPSLDPMVQEILRALAWGGDRRRGAARLELGGKRFGGASVTVCVEDDAVTLEVSGPSSVDALALGERLQERLEKRGLRVVTRRR